MVITEYKNIANNTISQHHMVYVAIANQSVTGFEM